MLQTAFAFGGLWLVLAFMAFRSGVFEAQEYSWQKESHIYKVPDWNLWYDQSRRTYYARPWRVVVWMLVAALCAVMVLWTITDPALAFIFYFHAFQLALLTLLGATVVIIVLGIFYVLYKTWMIWRLPITAPQWLMPLRDEDYATEAAKKEFARLQKLREEEAEEWGGFPFSSN